MIRVHCVDDDEVRYESATDRIYRLTLMISAARSMLAGGEAPKDTVDHLPDRSAANRLRAVLETISELAAWHADDEADPANPSPEDQVAHINGLIRRACADALSNTEDGAPKRIDMLTVDEIETACRTALAATHPPAKSASRRSGSHDYAHAVAQAERRLAL